MSKYESDLSQILYTLKYASKSRNQEPREVFQIDNENVGKPDYMAYMSIKKLIKRFSKLENKEYYKDVIWSLETNEMYTEARTIQTLIDTIYGSDDYE